MDEELAGLSDRELERLAYGRADDADSRARAAAAGDELARRAAAEAATTAEQEHELGRDDENAELSDAERAESALSPQERAHRRRMRTVGLASVLAAALALPVVGWALAVSDPDPLAIFERPPTEDERAWGDQLSQIFPFVTLGPRAFEIEDGTVGLAFRTSSVPDGRSTEWDAYCLRIVDDPTQGWEAPLGDLSCVDPVRFREDGVVLAYVPANDDARTDLVVWGPVGAPRVDRDQLVEIETYTRGITQWLAFGGAVATQSDDPFLGVDEPDRLLMGPAMLSIASGDPAVSLTLTGYLLDGESGDSEPEFCLLGPAGAEPRAQECAPYSTAVSSGISLTVTAEDGSDILVSLDPDGMFTLEQR